MLTQTSGLPPLKTNNHKSPESYAAASIRSEMSKIQQSLQKSSQIYDDYLSDLPLDITESIENIQKIQNSISKEIEQNKLSNFILKIKKYNTILDSLMLNLKTHIGGREKAEKTNYFASIYPSFEKSLLEQNQTILDNFEKDIFKKVDEYIQKNQIKAKPEESKFKLKSPFSNSSPQSSDKPEPQKKTINSFSTLDTALDLEKHNQRLQSLETKIEILLNQQKRDQTSSKNDDSQQTSETILKNHERIQQLLIKSNIFSNKIDRSQPPVSKEQPPIKMKKKSNIEQCEFDQLSKNVNEMNEAILARIDSFENFAEQKIANFNLAVDSVELKINDFENHLNNLNELMAGINDKIERVEENNQESDSLKPQTINRSDISKLIESFKFKLSNIQNEARSEIDQLRIQLNALEANLTQ